MPYNIGEYSVILRDHTTKSGETVTGWEIVEYHGANLNSRYIIPTSLTVDDKTYDVIGIGDRAYRWATMDSGGQFDIVTTSIRYVYEYAFYNLMVFMKLIYLTLTLLEIMHSLIINYIKQQLLV